MRLFRVKLRRRPCA